MIWFTRLEMILEPARLWRLPPDPAVTLRGALGAALIDLACVQEAPLCDACPHHGVCLIPQWYEPGRGRGGGGRPFIVQVDPEPGEPVGPGAPLRARWSFFGEVPSPEALLDAIGLAAERGLGRRMIPHRVARVMAAGAEEQLLARGGYVGGAWPAPAVIPAALGDAPVRGARLWLRTRLKLPPLDRARRAYGREDEAAPAPERLLQAAFDRIRKLGKLQGAPVRRRWPDPAGLPGYWEHHRFERRTIRSGTSGQPIDISGHLGVLRLGREAAAFRDLLRAMEFVHLGRQTSYGLGRLRVEWLPALG